MTQNMWLGLGCGIIVSLLSWSGNHEPRSVSIFPDGITVLVLLSYFMGVVRVQRRDALSTDLASTIQRVWPLAATCGLVLGVSQILLGAARFEHPDWRLFAFGFFGALVVCVLAGTFATAVAWGVYSLRSSRTA